MNKRAIIAASIQSVGVLAVSGGLYLVRTWAGLVAFGVGAIAFGIGVERSEVTP